MDTELPPRINNKESLVTPTSATDSSYLQGLTMGEDVSLLRQPMKTALTGFLEAKKAYENGTDQVRRLLIHECSIIYECNVCRNMFRSLANFISHKRIYCKLSSEGSNYRSYSDHNSSLIIQTTEQQNKEFWLSRSRSTGSSPVPIKTSTRDLTKVIERLKRADVYNEKKFTIDQTQKQQQQVEKLPATAVEASQPHDEMQEKASFLMAQMLDQQQQHPYELTVPVLQLESVPTTTQAVYQTLNPVHATDSIRTEVEEVNNLLLQTQQNTMIGPDGKAMSTLNHNATGDTPTLTALLKDTINPMSSLGEVPPISCKICRMTFHTEKTLNIHIKKKHTSTTYVFQCPTCSLTFLQPAAVIRHLANEHKKPLKRIRKMRELILKKRMQMGDVQVKGTSRELKRLRIDATKDSLENTNGCHSPRQKENGKRLSQCSHCQMTFEKRAAFVNHLANCSLKNKSTNKVKGCTGSKALEKCKLRVATTDEMETKLENQNSNISKALVDNQNTQHNPTELKNIDQASMMKMMMSVNQENETNIKTYDCEYLTQTLCKVNIKQEPQEEEFNSTSTQATTGSDINEMFENLEKQTFGEGLQVVSLDLMVATEKMEKMETEEEDKVNIFSIHQPEETEESTAEDRLDCINEVKDEPSVDGENNPHTPEQPLKPLNTEKRKQKGFRTVPASKQLTCRCKICNKQFNALSNLRRHISMFHYRARRFGCVLCDYRAFRRYDIVNHLSYIHKMQGERESMALEYVTMHEIPFSKDDMEQDIVVVEDVAKISKAQENAIKTYENKAKRKHRSDTTEDEAPPAKTEGNSPCDGILSKVVRKRIRKSLTPNEDSIAANDGGPRRPIRNCIKPVDNDFVYDLKEESQDTVTRLSLKRRITVGMESKNKPNTPATVELTPPIKITPYRLRTESLIPTNRETVKGTAAKSYRKAVCAALAAPSTLPEMPAGRPQMRPRLTMAFRSDSSSAPVIEATELEVARLKSTFFDDSFLEKFAKNSNPSFKMKPALLALNHSPLNSLLQKFENNSTKSLNSNTEEKLKENGLESPFENATTSTTPALETPYLQRAQTSSLDLINSQTSIHTLNGEIQVETSPPNGNHIMTPSSPPSTPRKRITLMQRLAENRAKRCDFMASSALEN